MRPQVNMEQQEKKFSIIIDSMGETKKISKKHHFDNKITCPGCGERIGFVAPTCPFCDESIPFWSDRAGKVMLGIGCFLALVYLVSLIYFWEEHSGSLLSLGEVAFWFIVALTMGDRATRY